MSFYQFLLVIRSRYKVALLVLFATLAFGVAISFISSSKYTAKTTIVVDAKSVDPLSGKMMPAAMMMPGYGSSQVDIISSDRVVQKAAQLLQLDKNQVLVERWQRETKGRGDLIVWLGELLKKDLDVKPSRESDMVAIYFTSVDPALSAAVANAIAQAYIETNLDLKVEPAKQYADWFGDRMKGLRANLEKAQSNLAEFQRKSGLVADGRNAGMDNAKLSQLSTQLVYAESQSADTQSKEVHAASADTMPDVMQNPVVLNIKNQIIDREARLQELGKNVGRNHPDYQALESEIALLKQKLETESRRVMSSIETANRVNKQREKEIEASIEKHKQQVFTDNKDRDQIGVLENEVAAAQKSYDFVLQQYMQSNLESQSTQTNITVLTPARPPVKPSSPNIFLNMIISLFFGIVLGAASAFAAEMSDRRVRTDVDLKAETGVPVLVQIVPDSEGGMGWLQRMLPKPKLAKGLA